MHEDTVTEAFTRQAEAFNRSAVANADELLELILELAAPSSGEHWLEAACGPGIIARRLAPRVAEVRGIDATPAMVDLARREAARQGASNAYFELGDVTALACGDESFDGLVARFALHHIPAPRRLVHEAARVVRPGGRIVMVDHVADSDLDSFMWTQEVERLRDPSHWASLPLQALRELGSSADLQPVDERIVSMTLDFEDWLERGSAGPVAAELVRRLVDERSAGTARFRLGDEAGRRTLELSIWAASYART